MKLKMCRLTTSFTTRSVVDLLAASSWLAASVLTSLGADVFTVDSSQSSVSISGSVLGNAIHEQGSGSLTAHYEGTLIAEVGDSTIRFPGKSAILAIDSGSWAPKADATDGSEPANYGGAASYFLTDGVAALRNLEFDVTSGAVAVVNGQFNTETLTCSIPATATSSLAYRVEGAINAADVVDLRGHSASGQVAAASLAIAGGVEVLTIPVNYRFYFSLASQNDTTVTLTGQLVATRSLTAPLIGFPVADSN